jgi:hypothetical protein
VGLIGVGFIGQQQDQQKLAAPMPGDIYVVKMAQFAPDYQQTAYPYGILKINSIDSDNVHFVIATNTYGNMKSARKSLSADGQKGDFYSSEQLQADITTLKTRYELGAIKEINR